MLNLQNTSLRSVLASIALVLVNPMALRAQTAGPEASKAAIVEMRSISFFPKSVTIAEGQSVVWKNVSYTDHSATSDDEAKSFDTNMIVPKASGQPLVFAKAGRFPYHCKMHGRTMSAVIIVTSKP
ncbi:MAG: cupredoxin domain-containing protein [Oligoflexus sp.]|nr:cupredoxin domain-containing protein [Oligoflexus sp.]